MPETIDYIVFTYRKEDLFRRLNRGIVDKCDWDQLIEDAKTLCCESSLSQILRYYDHYHIGDMGHVDFQEEQSYAIPERIVEPKAVITGFPSGKWTRQYQLTLWRDGLSDLMNKLGRETFDALFLKAKLVSLDRDGVDIKLPDDQTKQLMGDHIVEIQEVFGKIMDTGNFEVRL